MINEALLAPCGLYCGICGVYYATRDDNSKFLEKLLHFYQSTVSGIDHLTIEDLKCRGCLSDQISFFCRVCAIKECTRKKNIAGCHQCGEFPCTHIENFPVPVGKKVILRAIPYWRDHGTEQWVAEEELRYVCPSCEHQLFRAAKRCNKCRRTVDLD